MLAWGQKKKANILFQWAIFLSTILITYIAKKNIASIEFFDIILKLMCALNLFLFFIQIFNLKKITKTYLDPVIFFSAFLFLFSSGQLILFVFNIHITDFNIFERLSSESIYKSILFIIPAYSGYILGVCYAIGTKKNSSEEKVNEKLEQKAYLVGVLLILISIIPYTYFLYYNYKIVSTLGYSAYYDSDIRLGNLIGIGYYLFIGLVLLIATGKKHIKYIGLSSLLAISIIRLMSGDRGDGLVLLISSYLLFRNYIYKRDISLVVNIFFVTIATAIVPLVGTYRHGNVLGGIGILKFLRESNVVVSTLTNLGGTLFPLAKIIELVPDKQNFIHGKSYLAAIILVIPSPLRRYIAGPIANDVINMSPANWLMRELDLSYGPGFTPFAEAYLNFGYEFGILALIVFGYTMGKLIAPRNMFKTSDKLQKSISIVTLIYFAMSTRGSFNYVLIYYLRYVYMPFLIILIINGIDTKELKRKVIK